MANNGHFGSETVILVLNNGQFGDEFSEITVTLVSPKWPLSKKCELTVILVSNNGHFSIK